MSIVFYEAPMSSATPVAWALAELDLPHRRVRLDLAAGDQKKPEYLQLNPNGRVPLLVIDGQPLFEGLAIIQWLGDVHGVERGLWPRAGTPERFAALSWSTWAYVSYNAVVQRLLFASGERVPEEMRSPAQAELARRDLAWYLAALDGTLATRPYVAGDTFTLADVMVASVLGYGTFIGASLDAAPHVVAWIGRCQDRPAYRKTWFEGTP